MGMKATWHESMKHKSSLLIVEKNYMYAVPDDKSEDLTGQAAESYDKFSYIKDAVDEVIEKVLENGGDVEFVEKELLQGYDRIALIK